MLYPVNNKRRVSISLNGLWDFQFVDTDYVPTQPLRDPIVMAVPSSYNDLFTSIKEKEYLGIVAYEKQLSLPFIDDGIWRVRIGAASHITRCFIDGIEVDYHNGGFLPIDFEVTTDTSFRLTILVDNRLHYQTLPIASLKQENGIETLDTHFDFFNYAGIHRNVFLYHVPKNGIEDIIITTNVKNEEVQYDIKTNDLQVQVILQDPNHKVVAESNGKTGVIHVPSPILWDIGKGNLYTLCVQTKHDYYEETFGMRSIEVMDGSILLNSKEIYLKGFGMHEDHITIGKGNHSALNIRDFNLLKWINANSFRTSHYPYDEEMYYLADKLGFLVINEIPAVGMNFWSSTKVFSDTVINDETKQVHKNQLTELVNRDKNHPSVIMYSLANEANTHEENALPYFEDIFSHARSITNLPLMIVEWVSANDNKVAQLADVIGLNRYIGWYVDLADLKKAKEKLTNDLTAYYQKYNKPIIVTEFGTDTIAGLHSVPSVAFSEEFQLDFIKLYQDVFNTLDFIKGEHIWNFADFMTKQGLTRVNGNKKGVFTRDRQPKMVAHYIKDYWKEKR